MELGRTSFVRTHLSRINHMTEKQTCATVSVLDGKQKRMIHPHFDRLLDFRHDACWSHRQSGRRGSFGAFFIQVEERFVEDCRNVEGITITAWGDAVEVRASGRTIKRLFHSERL